MTRLTLYNFERLRNGSRVIRFRITEKGCHKNHGDANDTAGGNVPFAGLGIAIVLLVV